MIQQEIEQANLEKLAEQEAEAVKAKANENKTPAELEAEAAAVEAAKQKADQDSVYKKENERLVEEGRLKTEALGKERERRKAADKAAEAIAKSKDDVVTGPTAEEIDKLLEEKLAKRDFDQLIKQETADPEEQKLVKHHYENSIKRTGDVATDLKMAIAIANQHLVEKAKQAVAEREMLEGQQANFQIGRSYSRQGKPAYETNGTLKAAAAILDKLGVPEAKKHLR